MSVLLLPDLGDLFRLYPQLNAATITELIQAQGQGKAPLYWVNSDPEHPLHDAFSALGWQVEVLPGVQPSDEEDHAKLREYLNYYPQGRERISRAARLEHEFAAHFQQPLTIQRALGPELQEAAAQYHAAVRQELDEGPGTFWRQRRLDELTERLATATGILIAPLDDLHEFRQRLDAQWPDVDSFVPGEASRLRALANRAWQLNEEDDWNSLVEALEREQGDSVTPKAELDAAAANIYLATGQLEPARTLLERAAHGLQGQLPRSLPGLVLARLGQVRDLQGERDLAERTYRAVLALSFVPHIARETAQHGLERPFVLQDATE